MTCHSTVTLQNIQRWVWTCRSSPFSTTEPLRHRSRDAVTAVVFLLAHSCCFCCLGDRECFSDVCLNPILAFLLVARCTLVSPYKVDWRLHWNINFAKRYLIFSTISDALFRVCYQLFFMLCFCAPVCTVQYSLFQSSYPWVVKYIIIESAMWMLD